MALVLRKAVLPKNASFLKCLKGRPLVTATNKKNAAPISKAATLRPLREEPQKVAPNIRLICLKTMTQQAEDPWKKRNLVRKSLSCPCFSQTKDFEICLLPKMRSWTSINDKFITTHKFQIIRQFLCPQRASSTIATRPPLSSLNISNELKEACAVSVCPPPGGCCLPPPCNQPAKCLQHITGYYYYPYGTWFCGPYHIKTGPCGPCAGPVQPGGPCGPAPPNPGGPCGPSGVVLCGPGANCAQCRCCPCAPCGPCGPGCCGFCGPCSCGPCSPCCGPCYDPYSPCGLPGACAPCGACGSYSICNGPCGPCFNVPCVPIQVSGPVRPGGPCGPSLSSPFDLCARCCLFSPDLETDTYPFKTATSISSREMPHNICSTLDERNSPSSGNVGVIVPSRMNIYPSLNNSLTVNEPLLPKVQVRHFSTIRLRRSNLRNDLLMPKSESMDIVKADMSTYSRCCHGLCCNCHLLCNNKKCGCLCPALCQPRYIPSKEERDQPYIPPNCFCYSNTPNYRNPSPYPNPGTGIHEGYYYKRPWHPW